KHRVAPALVADQTPQAPIVPRVSRPGWTQVDALTNLNEMKRSPDKDQRKLRFGLPKGSLQEATLEKMAKAGWNVSVSDRSYIPYVDDEELEIRLIRAQEISRYVEHGYLDCGITGHDWIVENG